MQNRPLEKSNIFLYFHWRAFNALIFTSPSADNPFPMAWFQIIQREVDEPDNLPGIGFETKRSMLVYHLRSQFVNGEYIVILAFTYALNIMCIHVFNVHTFKGRKCIPLNKYIHAMVSFKNLCLFLRLKQFIISKEQTRRDKTAPGLSGLLRSVYMY